MSRSSWSAFPREDRRACIARLRRPEVMLEPAPCRGQQARHHQRRHGHRHGDRRQRSVRSAQRIARSRGSAASPPRRRPHRPARPSTRRCAAHADWAGAGWRRLGPPAHADRRRRPSLARPGRRRPRRLRRGRPSDAERYLHRSLCRRSSASHGRPQPARARAATSSSPAAQARPAGDPDRRARASIRSRARAMSAAASSTGSQLIQGEETIRFRDRNHRRLDRHRGRGRARLPRNRACSPSRTMPRSTRPSPGACNCWSSARPARATRHS